MEVELDITKQFQKRLPQFLTLTKKEKVVLSLIAQGLTNQEIGSQLLSSPHTVRSHRITIYKKLDISRLKEAINWSITFNLI